MRRDVDRAEPQGGVPQGDRIPLRRIETIERRLDEFNAATPAADADAPHWPPAPREQASTSH